MLKITKYFHGEEDTSFFNRRITKMSLYHGIVFRSIVFPSFYGNFGFSDLLFCLKIQIRMKSLKWLFSLEVDALIYVFFLWIGGSLKRLTEWRVLVTLSFSEVFSSAHSQLFSIFERRLCIKELYWQFEWGVRVIVLTVLEIFGVTQYLNE